MKRIKVILLLLVGYLIISLLFYVGLLTLSLFLLTKPNRLTPSAVRFIHLGQLAVSPAVKTVGWLKVTQLGNQVIDLIQPTYDLNQTAKKLYFKLNRNQGVAKEDLKEFQSAYNLWFNQLYYLYQAYSYWPGHWQLDSYLPVDPTQRLEYINLLLAVRGFVNQIDDLMGFDGTRTYYIFIQNNQEIRATGGFLGAYLKLKVDKGVWRVSFHDIYEHDGNLPGYVKPPEPIRIAFKHGFWRLRDANWDYDFEQAAKDISWFLVQSQSDKPDAVIAANYTTVKKIIELLGPIEIPDYQLEIGADNFYSKLHRIVEINFYPGSKYKSRLITQLGHQLVNRIKNADSQAKIKLFRIIEQDLNNREIMVYFFNPKIQNIISSLGWDGKITYQEAKILGRFNDYLYPVESNLSANKANCCIQRRIDETIQIDKTTSEIYHEMVIKYKYNQLPPAETISRYLGYLRVVVPDTAFNFRLLQQGRSIDFNLISNPGGLPVIEIGFWVRLNESNPYQNFILSYALPIKLDKLKEYNLVIQKQPGLSYFHALEVKSGDRIIYPVKNLWVDRNKIIKLKL